MFFLKPLFKTAIFASLIFLIIVFLGMKYHWISLNLNKGSETTETIIKNQSSDVIESNSSNDESFLTQVNSTINEQSSDFLPIIIEERRTIHILRNMTKEQLSDNCKQLFYKLHNNKGQEELFVGNCVVSNFHEVFQESSVDHFIDIEQVEAQRKNAEIHCRTQQDKQQNLLPLETELLVGICVSNTN